MTNIKQLWDERVALLDEIVANNPNFDRKGKTMPYTSANGHMFSLVNKDGELGFRLSKESGEAFIEKYNSPPFKSHGAFMRGYVLIPEELHADKKLLGELIQEAYEYVLSLKPK